MDKFTSLAITMHEIYEFGKFKIWQIRNENGSPSITNYPGITEYIPGTLQKKKCPCL